MIGFYIFLNRGGELHTVYETAFVPTEDVSVGEEFSLEPHGDDELYTIMPTTYADNRYGSFILSVATNDCDFMLSKETHGGGSHHQPHK